MKKIIIWGYCNLKLLLSPFKMKINTLSDNDMIDYVTKNNLSIIRYGDGEFRIIETRKGIHYQDFNEELCNEMEEVFYNYSKDSKYFLSIPCFFKENIFWFKKMPYSFTTCFAKCRLFFRNKHDNDLIYGDAFLFKKNNKKIYEKLWKDEKKIILIHNDIKWAKSLEQEYGIKVEFIKIPSKNSYDVIDKIETKIEKINKNKKTKILRSAGPMAKALCYRLCNKDFIIYDTGHCFDEPLILEENRK